MTEERREKKEMNPHQDLKRCQTAMDHIVRTGKRRRMSREEQIGDYIIHQTIRPRYEIRKTPTKVKVMKQEDCAFCRRPFISQHPIKERLECGHEVHYECFKKQRKCRICKSHQDRLFNDSQSPQSSEAHPSHNGPPLCFKFKTKKESKKKNQAPTKPPKSSSRTWKTSQ